MRKTRWHSALALLIVVAMLAGMLPVLALADTPAKKYVSLGDSLTNGFGLVGYDNYGYHCPAYDTYSNQLAQLNGWEHTALAISSLRAEDVYTLLTYGETPIKMDRYWTDYVMTNTLGGPDSSTGQYAEAVAKEMQAAVKEADVISLRLGGNNFGSFFTKQLTGSLKTLFQLPVEVVSLEYYLTTADLAERLSHLDAGMADSVVALYQQLMDEAMGNLQNASPEIRTFCETLILCAVYSMAGYMVGYQGVLDYISAVNPAAELIIVETPNVADGMSLDINNDGVKDIDLGELVGTLLETANTYAASLSMTSDQTIYYADIDTVPREDLIYATMMRHVTYTQEEVDSGIAQARTTVPENAPTRNRLHDSICEMLLPLGVPFLEEAMQCTIPAVTLAEIDSYVSGGSMGFEKDLACAVYLAFEDAVIHSLETDTINLGPVMVLAGDMQSFINGIIGDVEADIAQEAGRISAEGMVTDENKCKLAACYNVVYNKLTSDSTVQALLHMVARCLAGGGVGGHPNVNAHNKCTQAIMEAYGKHTAKDQTIEEIIRILDRLNGVWYDLNGEELEKDYQQLIVEGGIRQKAEALLAAMAPGDGETAVTVGGAVQKVSDAIAELAGTYQAATGEEYQPGYDSYYVAIGDASAAGSSYAKALAKKLGVSYKNLAKKRSTISDAFAVVEKNAQTIAKADLITLGFTSNNFINEAIDKAYGELMGTTATFDWEALVGAEYAQTVNELFAVLKAEVANIVPDETYGPIVAAAVEGYAYSCISYMVELPELVEAVREINPDAQIAIVGMYNTLENVSIAMGEDVLEVGKYLEYLNTLAGVSTLFYALRSGDVIYVDAAQVQTEFEAEADGKPMEVMELATEYLRNWGEAFMPSEDGHAYIAQRIHEALGHTWQAADCTTPATCVYCDQTKGEALGHTWVDATEEAPKTCVYCKATEGEPLAHSYENGKCTVCGAVDESYVAVLYGDANGDGTVNAKDAMLVLQFYTKKITEDKLDASVCDVDGNGTVNAKDAMLILQKYTKKIPAFPVEAK